MIDGAAIARAVRAEVARDVASMIARGVTPGLSVVLVGDDPASTVYVRAKGKACDEAGMRGETICLPATTSQAELLDRIEALNAARDVDGILVQMPLPRHIDAQLVVRRVDPGKDVDGFHPENVGLLWLGNSEAFVPCTPAGVRELLVRSGVETRGARAVIVGRSNIVGRPMAALLSQDAPGGNATVTICHSQTAALEVHTRSADILVAASGRAGLVTREMVKPGATVIDVGVVRVPDRTSSRGYRLVGDVDYQAVREVAGRITPVPGGVGPMTIAMLLRNAVRAASRRLAPA